MNTKIAALGMFLTALTIAIGAFGAHGLKQLVDASALNTFETGVRYQMYHALGLVILGLTPFGKKKAVMWLFLIGILFFSGSIYLLVLRDYVPFDAAKIGFITPVGGLLFIIGWIIWGVGILRSFKN